jgi:hypothetical protein
MCPGASRQKLSDRHDTIIGCASRIMVPAGS